MKEFDIAIVGAGPAGAMLTRFIQNKGYKIALIDARQMGQDYDGKGNIKSCGGMLCPRAQELLEKYKITLPEHIYDKTQPNYVETIDVQTGLIRNYKRKYQNIDREKFDRFLLQDLSSNVESFFGYRVKKIEENEEGFTINDEIKSRILVGADGATSKVQRTFFPEMKIRRYASIQDVLPVQLSKKYQCFFDEKTSDYYGWSLPKNDKTLVGYAIPQGDDAVKKFEDFKLKNGFGKEIERQGTIIARPNFFHKVYARDNLFLIGEAGGYISPSSAEGISFAFRTAEILARSDFDLLDFKKKMKKIQLSLIEKNIKAFFMSNPIMRKLIMKMSIFSK